MPLYHCVISSLTDRQSLLPSAPLQSAPSLRETLSVVLMQPVLLRQSVRLCRDRCPLLCIYACSRRRS